MTVGIYQIECVGNKKTYIGSSNNIEKRYMEHLYALRKNKHNNSYLQRSYNKYGESSFVHTILEVCSIDQLLSKEQYYLDIAFEDNNTFNLLKFSGRIICEFSEETRKKMSEAKKGKKRGAMSEEQKLKISLANTGKKVSEETKTKQANAKLGIKRLPMSDEQKRKISVAQKGKPRAEESIKKMRATKIAQGKIKRSV